MHTWSSREPFTAVYHVQYRDPHMDLEKVLKRVSVRYVS